MSVASISGFERVPDRGIGRAPFPVRAVPFIWHHALRRRWLFAGLFVVMAAAAACAVAVQFGMRLPVDAMSLHADDRSAAWFPFILFVGLIGLESACWRLGGWLTCRGVVATGVDIRLDLFEHLSGQPMRYFADQLSGSLGGRITATAGSVGGLLTTLSWSILPPCADFVGAFVLFLTVDWRMATALAVFVAVLVGMLASYGARGRPLHRAFAERGNRANGEVIDAVVNIWAVKAFSARKRERDRLARQFADEAGMQTRSWLHVEKTRALHDLGLWTIAVAMLAWCIHLWAQAAITPGEVVMVSAVTFRVLHGSREIALAMIGVSQELAVVDEALAAIARPHEVADHRGAMPFVAKGGAISFEEVGFAYASGRTVFERFSLDIPAGQKVGLVGESGAGKSTLVSLVQRFDDVQRGRILVDGRPIKDVTQDLLRAAIAVVPQEVSLFHRSILENIRYGRPAATDDEVIAAAISARAHEFIRHSPDGYGTLIGERGMKLSGGQRQRLGIARAILKNAPILVLDEATSALDSRSEAIIQEAMATLMRGRTVIAIAHRLSTLASLDRIIVLAEGQIVEDGAPKTSFCAAMARFSPSGACRRIDLDLTGAKRQHEPAQAGGGGGGVFWGSKLEIGGGPSGSEGLSADPIFPGNGCTAWNSARTRGVVWARTVNSCCRSASSR